MLSKIELEKNLDRLLEWVRASDQKASIFLAFQGIVLTIIISGYLKYYLQNMLNNHFVNIPCFAKIYFFITFMIFAYSVWQSVCSIMPKLKKNEKKSIIYFGDIKNYKLKDFINKTNEIDEEEYLKQLNEAAYHNALIVYEKYNTLRKAIWAFFVGSALTMFYLIYIFLFYY